MRRILLAVLAAALPAAGAEIILLSTGFTIRAERVETVEGIVRLHTAEGTMEIPADQIAERETVPDPPAPPPPPAAAVPSPAAAPRTRNPRELLAETARKLGLPAEFLTSVARVESAFETKAVSPKGAIGVMQLMPGTARELGVDPHDLEQNIEGGARLLRDLLVKYQNEPDQVRRALAAYNAGAGAVQRYNGTPPYAETQNYVEKVLREYHRQRGAAQ